MKPRIKRLVAGIIVIAIAVGILINLHIIYYGYKTYGYYFETMDSKSINSFMKHIMTGNLPFDPMAAIISMNRNIFVLDSPPYTLVSINPKPLAPGFFDVQPYNLSYYITDVSSSVNSIIYSGQYNSSYGATLLIRIYNVRSSGGEKAVAVIYAYISNYILWDVLLSRYIVLSRLGYQSMTQALREIHDNVKYRHYGFEAALWRILLPCRGGSLIINGEKLPLEAIVALRMPIYPLSKDVGWFEQTVETLYWSLVAQPALSLGLRLTYPPNTSIKKLYTEVLPRLIRSIAYSGVTYSSPGNIYETPLYLRLNGIGVCGDYSLSAMILGDSAFSAPVLKLSGRDPRTGKLHSISILLIPSSLYGPGKSNIDLDGDGKPDQLVKITDTAGLNWKEMKKGGFLNDMILDPGPTLYSVDPPINKGTYNWVYGALAGYPKLLDKLPSVLCMPWYNATKKLMWNIFMRLSKQKPLNYNVSLLTVWAYTKHIIDPASYLWLSNTSLLSNSAIIAEKIIGYTPVNTSLYAGLEEWMNVTMYFLEKYLSPAITINTIYNEQGIDQLKIIDFVLRAIWRAEKGFSSKLSRNLFVMGLRPIYKNAMKDSILLTRFIGWRSELGKVQAIFIIQSYMNCTYKAIISIDGRRKTLVIRMLPLRDKLIYVEGIYLLLVQMRRTCPNIIVTAKTIPSYPYPTHTYYMYKRIYNTSITIRIMGEDHYKHLSLAILISGIPPLTKDMINTYIFTPNKTFTTLPFKMRFDGYLNVTIGTNLLQPIRPGTVIGIRLSGNVCLNIYIIIPKRIEI